MDPELIKKIANRIATANLPSEIADLFSIENEEDIDSRIEAITKKPKPEFNQLLKDNPAYQSEFDKIVAKAMDTRESKLKEKFNLIKKDEVGGEQGGDPNPNEKESQLQKQLDELKNIVLEQQRTKSVEEKRKKAAELLQSEKIPVKFQSLFDFESETSIDEQFTKVKETFNELRTDIAVELGGKPPLPNNVPNKVSDKTLDEIVDNL